MQRAARNDKKRATRHCCNVARVPRARDAPHADAERRQARGSRAANALRLLHGRLNDNNSINNNNINNNRNDNNDLINEETRVGCEARRAPTADAPPVASASQPTGRGRSPERAQRERLRWAASAAARAAEGRRAVSMMFSSASSVARGTDAASTNAIAA